MRNIKQEKFITNWYWIKIDTLVRYGFTLDKLKERLTILPKAYGDEEPEPMKVYNVSGERKGYIGVPIRFRIDTFGKATRPNIKTFPAMNARKLPDPNHKQAPEGQGDLIQNMLEACQYNGQFSLSATGASGKTVCALSVAGQLNKSMVVIAPTIDLVKQWVDEAKDKLDLTDDEIGIVQGDKCEYEGKKITICSMKSLMSREYPKRFTTITAYFVLMNNKLQAHSKPTLSLGSLAHQYNTACLERWNVKTGGMKSLGCGTVNLS